MNIIHTVSIEATMARVFAFYSDVASWPAWDAEVAAVELPALREGAAGWLKPRHGPKAHIAVTEVTQDRSFTIESKLPFCRMQFEHTLAEDGGTTKATHQVRFVGPLSAVFRRLIGNGIDRALPQTLGGLKAAAEAAEKQP